jgi:hypothetical protein
MDETEKAIGDNGNTFLYPPEYVSGISFTGRPTIIGGESQISA